MWTLGTGVRWGACLSRVARGRSALRAAPPPPPHPQRALTAFGPGAVGDLKGRGGGGRGPCANGRRSRAGEAEDKELLRREHLLPARAQRMCLVHPEVKGWGPAKPQPTRAEWQVTEAKALVHTLGSWSVVEIMVVPTKAPDRKLIFGKGTLENLTEKIALSEVIAVFLKVERISMPIKKELEAAWGMQVFDWFSVVLHIFCCNAWTKEAQEARLQVALAELPVLRSRLKDKISHLDGHGTQFSNKVPLIDAGGQDVTHLRDATWLRGDIGGCSSKAGYFLKSEGSPGESFMQQQQRLMREKEMKIQKALDRLQVGRQHWRWEFLVVSMVGYTNSGKTALIKALTGDSASQPRDQLFATLDLTAHARSLLSRMTVIYMDPIGFLSQLPHSLIESFAATLEDMAHSDLIVHVRDLSHQTELEKASVLSALRRLSDFAVPHRYHPSDQRALAVSVLLGLGLEKLKAQLEDAILRATKRQDACTALGSKTDCEPSVQGCGSAGHISLSLPSPQLAAQGGHGQDVHVIPEAGVADIKQLLLWQIPEALSRMN
ncbi:LOW QUALITY PROTEIN: putative GTP-binding protein 6 [Rhynchonycteris naso]